MTGAQGDRAAGRVQTVGGERNGLETIDAAAGKVQALGTQAGVKRCPAGQCRRQGRQQHRLLGVGRAAHAAIAEIPAALDVAAHRIDRDAEPGGTACHQAVIPVRRYRPGADMQAHFHRVEPRRERFDAEIAQAVRALPPLQRPWRGAEAAGPVDRGRTADATALQDVDRLVGGLAGGRFLIQGRVGLAFAHVEIAGGAQRTFFDDDYGQPGICQDFGRHAAAGAAADNDDIGLDIDGIAQAGSVDMAPAGGQSCAEGIVHHFTSGGPG